MGGKRTGRYKKRTKKTCKVKVLNYKNSTDEYKYVFNTFKNNSELEDNAKEMLTNFG